MRQGRIYSEPVLNTPYSIELKSRQRDHRPQGWSEDNQSTESVGLPEEKKNDKEKNPNENKRKGQQRQGD